MKMSTFSMSMVILVLAIVSGFSFVIFRTDITNGDAVLFDFKGTVDGVAFDGGTATNYTLVIGSGSFIDGFEDQMVGHKAGDKFDVNVTFPANYSKADLAGKDAVFAIDIHGYYKPDRQKTYGNVTSDQLKELKKAITESAS